MTARTHSARPLGLVLAAAAAALMVGLAACDQSADDATSNRTTAPATAPATNPDGTAPTPGPGATPGCEVLTGPVFDLVEASTASGDVDRRDETADDDVAAASEDVRRTAAGVDDNALSAVASRLSGLAVQPKVDDDAVLAQWAQFRQLCDID